MSFYYLAYIFHTTIAHFSRIPVKYFQKKLRSDILKIKKLHDKFIFADTTNNVYYMHPKDFEKLIKNSTIKTSKKAPRKLEKSINLEAKNMAKNIS